MTFNELNGSVDKTRDFAHLNDMQREAVFTTDGPLLLLAGAGSGKTTVLMNRIAYLLKYKGVSPHEIIAITFTNKAAGEMKERLERMKITGAENVWARTFHSSCVRFLRQHIDRLGYSSDFTIYDTADSAALIKLILKEQGADEKIVPPKTVLTYISRAKDEMMPAKEYITQSEQYYDIRRRIIGPAFLEYENRMKAANALDFDDLILLTVKLFSEHPDVLEQYAKRFRYILVDEYQDTNNLQYRLTTALASGHGNICVVGDDDQSIYKFRGATIENILSFEKKYKNARVIRLEQNYRSTGTILNAANDVIRNNRERKGKKLWTENPAGETPAMHIVQDERAEAQFVADKIISSISRGSKWQEHAVLYRMNAQSNQFETAFKRSGIPYRIYGGTGFYERAEIKDMLAYLCLLHNPHDDVRLLRVINNPARGIGDTTLGRLAVLASDAGISLYDAIRLARNHDNLASAAPRLEQFADMIDELRVLSGAIPLDILYDELLGRTGYIKMLEDKNIVENLSRIENVRELKTNIIGFINENGGSLFDFLSETALYTDMDRDDHGTDRVLMMTMHSAKGLEFDTVFIVGAEEGIFPGVRAIGEPAEMEEERRLCYVAMTRAMRRLVFTSASRRMLFGKTNAAEPSCFMREINYSNIEIHDESGGYGEYEFSSPSSTFSSSLAESASIPSGFSNSSIPRTPFGSPNLKSPPGQTRFPAPPKTVPYVPSFIIGDLVEHSSFGRGVIINVTAAGGDALLEIEFDNDMTKKLMLNTAARYLTKIETE